MMSWIKRVTVIFGIIMVFVFAALFFTQEKVVLHFGVLQTPMALPVSVWMYISFFLGTVFGVLGIAAVRVKYGFRLRQVAKQLARKDEELNKLRSASINDTINQAEHADAALPGPG